MPNLRGSEQGPSGEVASVDGTTPCRKGGRQEERSMIEGDAICDCSGV